MNYTSLPLSKALADAGFDGESEYLVDRDGNLYTNTMPRIRIADGTKHDGTTVGDFFPAYDLIHDLCIKYAKEVWGELVISSCCKVGARTEGALWICSGCEGILVEEDFAQDALVLHSVEVFKLLQQGKKQDAEDYIMEHSVILNP